MLKYTANMSNTPEIEVSDNALIPRIVYHMVPENLWHRFTDSQGAYDCRNQKDWGNNSPFIHTTSTIKDLKERVAPNWETYPKDTVFVLFQINTDKISGKFSYTIQNKVTYFHIWAALPRDSFVTSKVERDVEGKFLLSLLDAKTN